MAHPRRSVDTADTPDATGNLSAKASFDILAVVAALVFCVPAMGSLGSTDFGPASVCRAGAIRPAGDDFFPPEDRPASPTTQCDRFEKMRENWRFSGFLVENQTQRRLEPVAKSHEFQEQPLNAIDVYVNVN